MKTLKIASLSFALRVEELVAQDNLSYLEAITHFGEENNIDTEALATLVNRTEPIKFKLEEQCLSSNVLRSKERMAVLDSSFFKE